MPDGSTTPAKRPGWLIRKVVLGERLVIRRPDRPEITLTLTYPTRRYDGERLVTLNSNQGVTLGIPRGVAVEVVPGIVLMPRLDGRIALRSDDPAWTRFEAPSLPYPSYRNT